MLEALLVLLPAGKLAREFDSATGLKELLVRPGNLENWHG
jgi:hypothetical protein